MFSFVFGGTVLINIFGPNMCQFDTSRTWFEKFDDLINDCRDQPVRELWLDGCRTRLTRLEKLPNMPVEKLTIYHCRIEEIADDAFENIGDTLVELDLSNNLITQFPNLTYLTKLKKLTLRDNKILSLPYFFNDKHNGIGDGVELSIEDLDLEYNEIAGELTKSTFGWLKNLKSLNLRKNHITGILPDALVLPNLTELYLDNNNITKLSSRVFASCPSLLKLSLTNNQISEVYSGVFLSSDLFELRLDYNNITKLPNGVFDASTSLYFLSLSNNGLTELPPHVFANLHNLTILNLDSNKLYTLSADLFTETPKITHLELSYNQISNLPAEVFSSLKKLQKLIMYFNNLTELPSGLLSNSEETEALYFHHNQIENVAENALPPLEYVATLCLSHNNLTTLRRSSFRKITKPKDYTRSIGSYFTIHLADNPLVCNDNLNWIVEPYSKVYENDFMEHDGPYTGWRVQREMGFRLPDNPICVAPEKYANQSVIMLTSQFK
uniref:LRRCT domain-containing protein n=1 Tax=Panagrellus redivivus TaxID=6233 RepID=A0A7E4VPS5_PANRE